MAAFAFTALATFGGSVTANASASSSQRSSRASAELMQRVFRIDVLTCPHCKGQRRLLAAVFDPQAIENPLPRLPTEAPAFAAARPPPQQRLPW
ncbi:MAG: hypothetical protein AB7O97_14260 [Planctomycetota bacterium]